MTPDRSHPYPRTHRVNESLREVLAEEVELLSDPRLGFVTITGVQVTPDLSRATVYYTVLGDDEEKEGTVEGLRSATRHLRHAIGEQVRLKRVPELVFEEDPAIITGMRVDEILKDIHPLEEPE